MLSNINQNTFVFGSLNKTKQIRGLTALINKDQK